MSLFLKKFSRRDFLKTTVAVGGAAALTGCSSGNEEDVYSVPHLPNDKETIHDSACINNCANGCRLYAHIRNGRLVKMSQAPMPDERYNRSCLRGLSHMQRLYGKNRLLHPLKRIADKRGVKDGFMEISWEQAAEEIGLKVKDIMNRFDGGRSVAFLSGSGSYGFVNGRYAGGWLRLFNALEGTHVKETLDLNLAHGLSRGLGSNSASCYAQNEPASLLHAKTILVWGSNLASAHMQTWHFVAEARDKGAEVISVDIMMSGTAARADKFVCLRPGSDTQFALAMIKHIIDSNLVKRSFMFKNTVANFLVVTDAGNNTDLTNGNFLKNGANFYAMSFGGSDETDLIETQPHATLTGKAHLTGTEDDYEFTGEYTINFGGHTVKVKPAYQMLIDHVNTYVGDYDNIGSAGHQKFIEETGVDPEVVKALAERYALSTPSTILTGFGPDHRTNGHHIYHALTILTAITGNMGIPGAGVGVFEPINNNFDKTDTTGINRAPVSGNVHVTEIQYPVLKDVFNIDDRTAPITAVDHFGTSIPLYNPITDTSQAIGGPQELYKGVQTRVRAMFMGHSNVVSNYCDTNSLIGDKGVFTKKNADGSYKMELIVVADMEMTDTALYADYILPACHWFEREDVTHFGTHPFMSYQQKLFEPMGESLPDWEIARKIAGGLGLSDEFPETLEEILDESISETFYTSWYSGLTGTTPITDDIPTLEKMRERKVMRVSPKIKVNDVEGYFFPAWRDGDDLNISSFGGGGRIEFYSNSIYTFADFGQAAAGIAIWQPQLTANEKLPVPEVPYEGWHLDNGYNNTLRNAGYTLHNFSQRIRWRVHTQWWDTPWIRELEPYPVVFINPADSLTPTGKIHTGDLVKVSNPRGSYKGRAIITPGVQPGMIDAPRGWQRWQYDEHYGTAAGYLADSQTGDAGSCNDVTSCATHPASGCQAFFDALIKIEKIG